MCEVPASRITRAMNSGNMKPNDNAECHAALTDQQEPRITRFVWSMAQLKEDLANWSDNYYTVEITMNSSEPGTVRMKFVKGEDGWKD